jgi:HD-GYP domain-containing protein (c-di-GMP phosphodiesterase class II)
MQIIFGSLSGANGACRAPYFSHSNLSTGAAFAPLGKRRSAPPGDRLRDDQTEVVRRHPAYAYEWLNPIPALRPALAIPYCHHERWDGTGYPRGLKGEQIPLSARMFAVVETWDALGSDRPYRKAWQEEEVRNHLCLLAGTHFDSEVVATFLRLTTRETAQRRMRP